MFASLHTPFPALAIGFSSRWLVGLGLLIATATLGFWIWPLSMSWELASAVGVVMGAWLVALLWGRQREASWRRQLTEQLLSVQRTKGELGSLCPIPATAPPAQGWNYLLAKVQQQSVWNGVERRLSESVNAQQARQWEAMVHAQSDGIVLCDDAGRILQANRASAAILGKGELASLLGKDWQEVLRSVVGEEAFEQSLVDTFAGSLHRVVEVQPASGNGERIWRVSVRHATHSPQGMAHTIWSIRDITQARLAEQAREQFVATATHELRTPLANIRAYAETLGMEEELSVEMQRDFCNTINNEASRLARFIDDLLNVSQMEAGSITLRIHEIHLDRLLEEIVDHHRPLANDKAQSFEYQPPPKIPRIHGDKDKLAAALTNLLGNAIKYTPNGGRVQLKVEYDASKIYMHVEDTGFGIAPEELSQLGSKFFRSHDDRVQSIQGNGLGLAFTQEVARLHGGNLGIRSQLNAGSCFTLELPLA